MFNTPSILEYFISHGTNVNEKDEYGKTTLHYAAINNSKETAELILSLGANINEKDEDGKTALHFATIRNSREKCSFSHGENFLTKNILISLKLIYYRCITYQMECTLYLVCRT